MTKIKTQPELCFSYLPINVLTNWERASISANFLSNFLTTTHTDLAKDNYYRNTISTMINEAIEYSVKHCTFKNSENYLTISIENNLLLINVNCNVLKTHFYLLKALMRKLNTNKHLSFLDIYDFSGDFSNFIFCLHTLINKYNANIKLHSKKSHNDPLSSVNLKLKLKLKEEYIYDYQN